MEIGEIFRSSKLSLHRNKVRTRDSFTSCGFTAVKTETSYDCLPDCIVTKWCVTSGTEDRGCGDPSASTSAKQQKKFLMKSEATGMPTCIIKLLIKNSKIWSLKNWITCSHISSKLNSCLIIIISEFRRCYKRGMGRKGKKSWYKCWPFFNITT